MAIVLPSQNPQRYSQTDNGWRISSVLDSPDSNSKEFIVPIDLNRGNGISMDSLKPLLEVDDIVVNVEDYYLVSEKTLNDIKESNNPHWDIQSNGEVKDKPVGKTIPIISVNVSKLMESGNTQDSKIVNAGVQSVEYIYETQKEMDVPIGLIRQLNYTLKESELRPGDSYNLWDMNLGDESLYSIAKLKVDTAQEDGRLDKGKLDAFLVGVDERLKLLRADFNMIKNTFYNGVAPISKGTTKIINKVATTESTSDVAPKQQVFKDTNLTSTQPQPISTAIDSTQKTIDEKTTDVQKQIEQQKLELQSTQQKQTLAQQQLQQDLNQQAQRTDEYYKQKYGAK